MKMLTTLLLTLALAIRPAPLCAAPVATEVASSMPECNGSMADHENDQSKKGQNAARVCPSCVVPPASAAFAEMPQLLAVDVLLAQLAAQLRGGALKPPVPPPRVASSPSIHYFNGVLS